jgi:signal transduction histidine kinase
VLAVDAVTDVIQVVVAGTIVVILVARWTAASRPARRVAAPVALAGVLGAVASVLDPLLSPHGRWLHVGLSTWVHLSVLLLPLAFLLGIWRGRPAVADLLIRMPRTSPDGLRDVLAWALRDPSLQIGYVRDDGYVDENGHPLAVPTDLTLTPVERDGRTVAALMHDPALRDDRDLLRAVASAVALELDNQRLAAEVRAQLTEVRESRARIVAAGDEQRRKVERDLHDGAQQQLVTVALLLRMARERLDEKDADPELAGLLARGAAGLDGALGELRELARGIHPAVLSDAGLLAAVRALAARCPLPVHVTGAELPPLPPAVETAAYFVVAEAVTNALRHSEASAVRVEIRADNGVLDVSVTDDGVGGASFARGTGLTGLRDRVSAVDGRFTVHSGRDTGTTVRARISVP